MSDRDLRRILNEIIDDLDSGRLHAPRPRRLMRWLGAPVLAASLGLGVAGCEDRAIGYVDDAEVQQIDAGHSIAALNSLLSEGNGLISDEDLEEFAVALSPGSSAAVLAFEHTWFKPLRDELVGSGGVLIADLQIPGLVVQEVLDAVAAAETE